MKDRLLNQAPTAFPVKAKVFPSIDCLTGLRFFAALAIVIGHTTHLGGLPFGWLGQVVLSQGVSFFFVLSGFILAINYGPERGPLDQRKYFLARSARILPIYLVCIAIGLSEIWATHGGAPFSQPLLWGSILLEASMLQAWVPTGRIPINGPGWSISVEMFFYLLFPFFIQSARRIVGGLIVTGFAVIALMIAGQAYGLAVEDTGGLSFHRLFSYIPFLRLPEFLLGALLGRSFAKGSSLRVAKLPSRLIWSILEAATIGLCYMVSVWSLQVWMGHSLDHILGGGLKAYIVVAGSTFSFALLIWIFAHQRGFISEILSWRPIVFLGEVSFALYLLHVSLIQLPITKIAFGKLSALPPPQQFLVNFGFYASLLVLATGLYLGVEKPARRFLRRGRNGSDQANHQAAAKVAIRLA